MAAISRGTLKGLLCNLDRFRPLFSAIADRYSVVREIGRGGTAVVFLARDLAQNRDVAIKVLRPELGGSLAGDRFLREIEHASRLKHPRILPMIDWGRSDDLLYSVMPYVAGSTLRQRIQATGALSVPDVVRLTTEIAEALAYAHSEGIVHRDIKPANILLSNGQAVVADFGLARAIDTASGNTLTSSGLVVGTPEYMSPEQGTMGGRVDARSDIYSLGCVVYEMLCGEPPFTGPNSQVVITRHMHERPRSLRLIRPTLPRHFEAAVEVALAKVPADRFQDSMQFARALEGSARAVPLRGRLARIQKPVALASVGIAVAAAALLWKTIPDPLVPSNAWPITSLAVMPFSDLTSDRRYGWLAEGLTNELIDALASVPELDVRTFEAAQSTQGVRAESIASHLRVGTVVRGTLEQAGGRLTLTVRVAEAGNPRAVRPIRVSADPARVDSLRFGLIDLVSVDLRRILGSNLELARRPDRGLNRRAWELYRRAEALSRNVVTDLHAGAGRRSLDAFHSADTLYAQASALAPRWADPRLSRAWLYEHHARFIADTSRNQCVESCLEWRRRALALLRGDLASSIGARELQGTIDIEMARAPELRDSASALVKRGEELLLSVVGEDSTRTRAWMALSTSRARRGDPDGAVVALRAAQRADPWMTMEPEVLERWGTSLRAVGDFDEAARLCELGRVRYPNRASFKQCRLVLLGERGRGSSDISNAWEEFRVTTASVADSSADVTWWFRRSMVAAVLARSGQRDSAYAVLAESRRLRPTHDPNLLVQESFVSAVAHDTTRVVELLGRFLQQVPSAVDALARERRFRNLHGAPAFDSLLRRR